MNLDFKGKNVLVTGGSKNIGKGIVECFLETGANVVFTYHENTEKAEETYNEFKHKAKGHFSYFKADCGNSSEVEATFDYCAEAMGTVDFLINNAAKLGKAGDRARNRDIPTIMRTTTEVFCEQLNGTLSSTFYHIRRMVRDCIKENKGGRIVNISSKAAISTKSGILDYAAAKAGVNMLTHVTGLELAEYGIITTAIMPGFVDDDYFIGDDSRFRGHMNDQNIGPLGRVACGRDMGEMVVALCTEAGTFAIGESVDMTGGRLLQ
ncbi:MAG: SDR family oxidoreductase [Oscillospiraceae bacterium]|nr:SDR family oxidoreductase [Oscillospiraceae bacterium]